MITAVSSTYYIADTEEEVLTITGTAPLGKVVRCLVNATGVVWKRVDGTWSSGGEGGGVELGETSSTAYRGDRGKLAYDRSQLTVSGTAAVDFGSENDHALVLIESLLITDSNIKSVTFLPQETTVTSLDDFSLNGVSFNIESITNNSSFYIRATAANCASGVYTFKYIINYN